MTTAPSRSRLGSPLLSRARQQAAAVLLTALVAGAHALELRIDATEAALRDALAKVAAGGGGRITFNVSGAVIGIEDRIYFYGNDMVLDGEDRNITFKYTGPDACSQTEGQDHLIEIHGDKNVVRNFTLDRFPEGIHIQSGHDNVVENIRFPKVCEDAVTNNGRGLEAFRTIIRNCYFEDSEDKAVMINDGGSVTVENCEFVNCQQPVRAGGKSGRHVIRKCQFRGRSTGPRFNGGAEGMAIDFEDNLVEEAAYGIRVYGSVQAIIRGNRIRPRAASGIGVYVDENARARLEANDIQGAAKGGVLVQGAARVDLGGGRIVICGDGTASAGGNTLKGNRPAALINETETLIKAKHNVWDHKTAAEVLGLDVRGPAEVEPLGRNGNGGLPPLAGHELPGGYYRLMEAAVARMDAARLPAAPEARPQNHYYPGALLVSAVLYAKKHPANPRHGQPRMLELALKLGDLLAAEHEAGIYVQRGDHHRDTYMWLEAWRLLRAQLGAERERRWRRALEALIAEMAADVEERRDRPAYTSPFGVATNHTALRASTAYLAGRLFGKPEWERLGAAVIDRYAAEEQSPDGYWGEHSRAGPTTAYDYLTSAGVALYYEHS
ncbi:MAG: right-handed parallel beta-helix repeat-containing protein, partial [Acidobacteriota bacterium]